MRTGRIESISLFVLNILCTDSSTCRSDSYGWFCFAIL